MVFEKNREQIEKQIHGFEFPRVFVRLDHIALMDLTRFCIFRVTFEPDFTHYLSVSDALFVTPQSRRLDAPRLPSFHESKASQPRSRVYEIAQSSHREIDGSLESGCTDH